MALQYQAFVDDSYSKEEFVLAGHVATAEKWADFAKEWEELLPLGTRAKNGNYHFKMSEMARIPERMQRVPVFYNLIEKHALISISYRMNLGDFARAKERMAALASRMQWDIIVGPWHNQYFFAFRGLIDSFHKAREKMAKLVPLNEQVDFIFDNQSEKSLLPPWNEYVSGRPEEVQNYFGSAPRFEDDQKFLPLQAADLWACWVRDWYEEDAIELPDKMKDFDFGKWRGKERPTISWSADEDQILDLFQQLTFDALPYATRRDFSGPV